MTSIWPVLQTVWGNDYTFLITRGRIWVTITLIPWLVFLLQVSVQSEASQSMLIVILHASFPCRDPFSQSRTYWQGWLNAALRRRLFQNVNVECQKNVFDKKLCMQQPTQTLTLSLTLSSREQTSFSLIFHFQRLWSLSLCDIWGYFPNPLYSVSFSLQSLT